MGQRNKRRSAIDSTLLMLTVVVAGMESVVFAQAPASSCAAVAIEIDAELDAAWRAAGLALRDDLAARPPGECTALRLRLMSVRGAVVLRAESTDGRAAERTLHDSAELTTIALGLLVSIPPEAAVKAAETPAPERPPPIPEVTEVPEAPSAPKSAVGGTESTPEPNLLAGSVSIGVRLAEPTHVLMGDLELRAEASIGHYLLIGAARFAPFGVGVEGAPAHFAYDELGLGVGVGRRFAFGSGVVDLSTMPSIVIADEEASLTGAGADPDTLAYLRWGVTARWLFDREGSWRLGTALDADIAPSALDHPIIEAPLLPPIPTWSVALHFVASGELQ